MIKVVSYDKFQIVYNWKGLNIVGNRHDVDSFKFKFPEIHISKALKLNIDISYVFDDYEIPRFGDDLKTFVNKIAKEDLESKLKAELEDPLKKKVLLMLVMSDIVMFNKQ